MKLEWTIQYGRLVADRFESMARNVEYVIEPDEKGWGAKAIRVCDGMMRTDPAPTRMPLQELVEWCEKDAERPAECPPQPIEPGMPTAETFMKMSGETSEFPSTMNADDWGVGFIRLVDEDGRAGDLRAVREWFQAALSHGFREGEAAAYKEIGKAQRERDCFGPKTSSPLDSFDARVWAEELRKAVGATDGRKIFAVSLELMETWFANALMRGYDEHRWKTEKLKIDSFEDEHAWSRRLARNYLDDHRLTQIDAEVILAWLAECIRLGYGRGRLDEKTIQGAATEAPKPPSPPAPEPPENYRRGDSPATYLDVLGVNQRLSVHAEQWRRKFKKVNDLLEPLQQRTAGLDGPGLRRRMDELAESMDTRLSDMERGIANPDLKLARRVGDLEAKVRRLNDRAGLV